MEIFKRPKYNLNSVLLGLLLIPVALSAYRKDLLFSYLGVKEGLSQNNVSIILKDRDGFMWFATMDGLNRYDGRKFIVYRYQVGNPNSLSSNSVSALIEDNNGDLWIGTNGQGLDRLDKQANRITHYRYRPGVPGNIGSDLIRALCQDNSGNLWIATDRGLACREAGQDHFEQYGTGPLQATAGLEFTFILAAGEGNIWIGTNGAGLLQYHPQEKNFRHIRSDPDNEKTPASNTSSCACLAPDGRIWIGHDRGQLSRLDPKTGELSRVSLRESANRIRAICADRQGHIWTGSNDGIVFLDPPSGEQIHIRSNPRLPASLSSNSVNIIFVDETDILWAGGFSSGINKCNLKAKRFTNYIHDPANPNSLGFHFVRGIYQNPAGIVYVGGEGLLDRFDPKTSTWTHFPINRQAITATEEANIGPIGPSGNPTPFCFCPESPDPLSHLWVGTAGGGLFLFDQKRLSLRPVTIPGFRGGSIYGMHRDADGLLWICSNEGLNQYDPRFNRNRFIDLRPFAKLEKNRGKPMDINVVVPDKEGVYWIGSTEDGLFSFDPRSGDWKNYPHIPHDPHSLSHNRIPTILASRAGDLWIGTYGGGLNRLNRTTGKFDRFTTRQGLPNDVVYGLTEDQWGHLWISTNLGLCRFDPASGVFRSFTDADGLIINEFNSYSYFHEKTSGRFYFGGIKGVTTFLPEEILDDPHPPSVVIEDLKIFNRSVQPGPGSRLQKPIGKTEQISLSYRDSMLTFEFNGLHYVAPAKNRLAYFLEGFDQQWNETDMLRPYATYTNLNPGKYTLRIKAANCDGVWSTSEKRLKIYIAPPFWKTWWFILTASLLSIVALISFYQTRVRGLKKRKAELESLVAQRTQELREMSLRDPLTGLRNRRFIVDVLKQELNSFINSKNYLLSHPHRRKEGITTTAYGVFMIDIDHFKAVNDAHSHEVGDRFLMQLSDLLCDSIREDDVVIRMGGEEFLLVLKKSDPNSLGAFAKKLKDKIEAMEFKLQDGSDAHLFKTCSIGFAAFPFYPDNPSWLSFDQLVTLADLGMMHAKKNGRNLAVRVNPGENLPQAESMPVFLASLEHGLQNGQIQIEMIS